MRPYYSIFFLFLILPSLVGFRHIPQGASEAILNEAAQGQKLIFERRYPEAKSLFQKLAQKYPNSPLGTFGLMALYNAQMFENYDFSLEKDFEITSQTNEKIVDAIVKNKNSSAWNNFLCGASAGLRGFYYIRKDKALKAFGQAGTADKCLKRALEKDPKFLDVNLGLGMSQYWRSVFTQSFKILPFFKDRRPEGIQLMKKAISEGSIANTLARAALMFVYLQDRKPRQGLNLAETLLKEFPMNIIAQLHKGRFLFAMAKRQDALNTFNAILQETPQITVALFFKGRILMLMGKQNQAKTVFETFLKSHPNPAWRAYTYYQLGIIALREKDPKQAMRYFKAGSREYGGYKPNLKRVLKMRRESK